MASQALPSPPTPSAKNSGLWEPSPYVWDQSNTWLPAAHTHDMKKRHVILSSEIIEGSKENQMRDETTQAPTLHVSSVRRSLNSCTRFRLLSFSLSPLCYIVLWHPAFSTYSKSTLSKCFCIHCLTQSWHECYRTGIVTILQMKKQAQTGSSLQQRFSVFTIFMGVCYMSNVLTVERVDKQKIK